MPVQSPVQLDVVQISDEDLVVDCSAELARLEEMYAVHVRQVDPPANNTISHVYYLSHEETDHVTLGEGHG